MLIKTITHILKDTPLCSVGQQVRVWEWEWKGKPIPPPSLVKATTLEMYAQRFGLRILVETGTNRGYMVDAMRNRFERIYSIELDQDLCLRAKRRVARWSHISILQGDSGDVLPQVLAHISQPCLFWLDAHYMGDVTSRGHLDTPINKELGHIFQHPVAGHVILIDDARLFTGKADYPTIEEVRVLVEEKRPGWVFEVEQDIIRIHAARERSVSTRLIAIAP